MDVIIRKAKSDDFLTVYNLYSRGFLETKGISLPSDNVRLNIEDFYVAICEGKIVSQMAITFPHEIKYISPNGEFIQKEDAFLHSMYTSEKYRGQGLISKILKKIESDAKKNQQIQYLYIAPENLEISKALENRDYMVIGKECRSCVLGGNKCRNIPLYRKNE